MLSTTLIALLLHGAPITIELLGFAVEVRDRQVVVVEVRKGTPAEKAKLERGDVLTRLIGPMWLFAQEPLATLSPVDLHDALTPPRDEALFVEVVAGAEPRFVAMSREDPGPSGMEFFSELLSPEQIVRLTVIQQATYRRAQDEIMRRSRERARDLTPLATLGPGPHEQAFVSGDGERIVLEQGAQTPLWIYFEGFATYECPRSALQHAELRSEGPIAPVVTRSRLDTERVRVVAVEVALWRVQDVLSACQQGLPRLASVKLTATVSCEGEAAQRAVSLSRDLALSCGAAGPKRPPEPLAFSLPPNPLVVGEAGPGLQIFWGNVRPIPRSVTIVELDAAGRELRKHQTLRPPADEAEPVVLTVPLDTRRARTLGLALLADFHDGSTTRTPPQAVTIETAAERAARTARADEVSARQRTLVPRLFARGVEPCADAAATRQWLLAQPEVLAEARDSGRDVSLVATLMTQYFCPQTGRER